MALITITEVVLAVMLVGMGDALPVSQSHRFGVYTPYWYHTSRSQGPSQDTTYADCGLEPCANEVHLNPLPSHTSNDLTPIETTKRNQNLHKSGWTMGGMPFSVLYMNPKPPISVRSPIAEPLRASPQTYDNSESHFMEVPSLSDGQLNNYVPGAASEAYFTPGRPTPTLKPTRRQYSIIPQLFVSYGWGPLSK